MKFESEHVVLQSNFGDKPLSRPFEYNDLKLKGVEKDTDQLPYTKVEGKGQIASSLDYSENVEFNDSDGEIRAFMAPIIHSANVEQKELYEKKASEIPMDRNSIECEPPEMMIHCKDNNNTSNVVKDICVDEGKPSWGKILFDSSRVDDKGHICTILPPWDDPDEEVMKEQENAQIYGGDELKASVETHSEKDSPIYNETDITANDISKLLIQDSGTENSDPESANIKSNEIEQQYLQISNENEKTEPPVLISGVVESTSQGKEEETLEDYVLVEKDETGNENSHENNLPLNNKVEKGSVTFDLNSSPAKLEDRISDNRAVSSQVHNENGESSFSAVGPPPSLISYSGPIAYSGSLSLRSESSTTSTRSFAFPILQSEWNCSPVKMAKADRKRLGKDRGWRRGCFCCGF